MLGFQDSITYKALKILPSYKSFRSNYSFLKRSQFWSREQIKALQIKRLKKLIDHAYENVPYYRNIFNDRNLMPEDINDLSDLNKIPFLTKEIIRDNLEDLKAKNYPKEKFEYVTTGGSTGIPLGFYYERGVSRAIEWAFMKSLWDRVGFRFRDKCVVLRGNIVESSDEGRFWKTGFFGRWLILSTYHMTDDNLWAYIEKIDEFKPRFIQAYASAITILATFMKENGIKPFPTVQAILCGSENLYPWQREMIGDIFKCRVFSWYGNSEQTVLAGECECGSYYHIMPEYGIAELIGSDGRPVTEEGVIGEVVTTGLNNYVFPLIRYRTMDLASLYKSKCSCGRDHITLERVEGRLQEFVVTGEGRLISMVAINMHSDVFDNVKQFQFYQEKAGELVLNIVRKESYDERDTNYIKKELHKKLGKDVDLDVKFVDNIPRTKSGKYRFLIQKIPIVFGDA